MYNLEVRYKKTMKKTVISITEGTQILCDNRKIDKVKITRTRTQ